jgi:hypothetical protein
MNTGISEGPQYVASNKKMDSKYCCGPYPSSDQSEAILAKMGLQVVWLRETWYLIRDLCPHDLTEFDTIAFFILPREERTLANNEALAYCCTSKKWKPKLERAIEEVKG